MSSLQQQRREVIGKLVAELDGKRVIQRILIANNGMAATKAILSMRQWSYMVLGKESGQYLSTLCKSS